MDFTILEKAGVRQTEFAKLVGVSKIAVHKWTKGGGIDKRHSDKINKIMNAIEGATADGYLPIAPGTPHDERIKAIQKALVKHLRKA